MTFEELDDYYRTSNPELYDSVMTNLHEIRSLEEFRDCVRRADKGMIGSETRFWDIVFDSDPEVSFSEVDLNITRILYRLDGQPVADIKKALLAMSQVIYAEFECRIRQGNIEPWMTERRANFVASVEYTVQRELDREKFGSGLADGPVEKDTITESAQSFNEPDMILPNNIIVKLWRNYNDVIWHKMPVAQFIGLFDLNNPTYPKTLLKPGQQNNFVFLLSLITSEIGGIPVNEVSAKKCFGIRNYKRYKSGVGELATNPIRKRIKDIFKSSQT